MGAAASLLSHVGAPVGVMANWKRCRPWLEAALEHARGTHLIGDVQATVERGDAQFWPGARCAVVTEVRTYPRLRELHIWLCGGDLRELVEGILPRLETFARTMDCARVTTAGRAGWQRVLKSNGYHPHWHCCAKELST